MPKSSNRNELSKPLLLALSLHVVILLLAFFSISTNQQPAVSEPSQSIIHAVAITQGQLHQTPVPKKEVIIDKVETPEPEKEQKQQEQQKEEKKVIAEKITAEKTAREIKQKALLAKKKQVEDAMKQKALLAKKQKQQELLKKRQQLLASDLEKQLAAEEKQLQVAQQKAASGEVDKYKAQILQAIGEKWIVSGGISRDLSCKLLIRLAPGGMVLDVKLLSSSGDTAFDRSAIAAVYKASPLPIPTSNALFNYFRELSLTVHPE